MESSAIINNSGFINVTILSEHAIPKWALTVELVYLIILIVIGLPGNSLIILVQMKNKAKVTTDYYVLTMAFFDFLSSTINAHFRIFVNTEEVWKLIVSDFLCSLRSFFVYITSMSSAFLLVAIALDRYIKTCKPLTTAYTTVIARNTCFLICILSSICSLHSLGTYYVDKDLQCSVKSMFRSYKHVVDVINSILTISVYVLITIAYINVSITLHERKKLKLRRLNVTPIHNSHDPNDTILFGRSPKVGPSTHSDQGSSITTISFKTIPNNQERHRRAEGVTDKVLHAAYASNDSHRKRKIKDQMSLTKFSNRNISNVHHTTGQGQAINKTTRIMVLLTLIYVLTWLLSWLRVLFGAKKFGEAVNNFARSLPMINCVTNPIIFYWMSSKFRANAKRVLFCKSHSQRA